MSGYIINYYETKYKSVYALTTDTTGGITVPNGETVAIARFRANGSDPSCYIYLAWDIGGDEEFIVASTKGDIDIYFDVDLEDIQFTGNGTKKLKIVIENNNLTASPIVGGSVEVIKLG